MQRIERKTIATVAAQAAPLRIIWLTLPLWIASALLALFMPATGIILFVIIAVSLLWLPFSAKKGKCPHCSKLKTFPFSGFGNTCQQCGNELVLRGSEIHLLEPKPTTPKPPAAT